MKYSTAKIVEKKTLNEDNKQENKFDRKNRQGTTAVRKTAIRAIKAEEQKKQLSVYIGWDSREPIAADVCKHSLIANSSKNLNITYLKQEELRKNEVYTRPQDKLGSTEFTFTRFLVPSLNQFTGWAVFVDCDFVWLDDIYKLLENVNDSKAVYVVQHEYTPKETVKMDGQQQHLYPRKNWSSMILWNCNHPKNQKVDRELINTATGQYLHRFQWLEDDDIGNLSPEWNWLVGWYKEPEDGKPKALHYTLGGPWFEEYENCEYADVWNLYRDVLKNGKTPETIYRYETLTLPPDFKQAIDDYFTIKYDPHGLFHDLDVKKVIKNLQLPKQPSVLAILDGEQDEEAILKNDKILENFVVGANGAVGRMDILDKTPTSVPVVLRSIAKRKVMKKCRDEGRDYYYVDTGYFGNDKRKHFHRVTKNAMQWLGKLDPNCADDRFLRTMTPIKGHTSGDDILICPPSEKAMKYWNMDVDEWLEETVKGIKQRTDREIVIRKKGNRTERTTVDTMEMALNRNVHCMVTFNSIAAVESLIYGKPVFVLGPSGTNAGEPLSNTDLDLIDDPWMPTFDEVRNLCCNLAYHQFTVAEFRNGTAWAMLNGTV